VTATTDPSLADIERVYRHRLAAFVRVAQAVVGNRETALDAVHEGFAAAIRGRQSFRRDGPLEAWLWRAVVNAARKSVRDAPRGVTDPTDVDALGAGPTPALREASPLVAGLPERQRLTVFLRYYADLDYRSIAEILGVTVGTVSASLAAAHAHVRSALEEQRHA
jgi:RNA polymerase sigma-70 factor (ECF subfamily)